MRRIGADGCRSGWVWMELAGSGAEWGVVDVLEDLIPEKVRGDHADVTILVDMPVGLLDGESPGEGVRQCDREARRMLTRVRGSSVFPVPARAVLQARSYQEAQALNRADLGKGLSKQAWYLVPRMREVDEALRGDPTLVGRIREAHPEVCFAGLAGRPMAHGKKTVEGRSERLGVLEEIRPGLAQLVESATADLRGPGLNPDDVVDAAVLALCASELERCRTLPQDPPVDRTGIPMEMVYLPGLREATGSD